MEMEVETSNKLLCLCCLKSDSISNQLWQERDPSKAVLPNLYAAAQVCFLFEHRITKDP